MSDLISKAKVKGAKLINMQNRINYFKVAPEALEIIMDMEKYTRKTLIDKKLRELVKIRVSQINGCSYCLNMHTKAAKKLKVTDEQIEQLKNWKVTNIFSQKEKMAFELSDKITCISENEISDELYQRARNYFDEKEYVDLVMTINQINMWNRLSISMGNTVKS